MRRIIACKYVILAASLLPIVSKAQNANDKGFARLGASQINITPNQPVIMSGYDARKTPSTGVHDSLFASALFFSGERNKALLISADLIGFPSSLVDTLKKSISLKTGLLSNNIMIIATHNHGGPAIHTYEDKLPQANEDYINDLKQKIVTLSVEAMRNPVPFRMGMAKGICTLNINRRAIFADGGVWLGRNPDGPCDHELDVLKFTDEKDNLLALLVNWPCHGTVTGQENYDLTGDWPSSAARFIKKLAGKNVIVAVTAGASADINSIYGPGNDFNEVEAVGYHVANETWKVLSQAQTARVKSVEFAISNLTFPGKKPWKDQFPQSSVETGSNVEIRLSALKLDRVVLCGVSGELMTEMGMQIKKESSYPSTLILTHCNGSSGYICTDEAFREGGYEPKVSRLMPGIEKPLVQKCVELIHAF